jgi:DNA-binding NtrC family response regulator
MDKPIILIAVDDEGARRSIAELLHGQGYDVLDAAGRSEVMACVHERAPDLVIVGSFRDATWDALEVAREVRKTDRMLPVIMVNGRSAEDLAIAAVKAGITDYFKPPISFGRTDRKHQRVSCRLRAGSAFGGAHDERARCH